MLLTVVGRFRITRIEGGVERARQGREIVFCSKSESLWLQPLLEAPFTTILPAEAEVVTDRLQYIP